ncbi:MAG: APC family permease [Ruminococcus flavefaciens]|nr:APC family permease [Ruminococcus flavefaciens]MCM1061706.1 APC family permease [Eubacterium sp.]
MKKIGIFGAVSTGVGMLIATSCFVSSASGSSLVGTPFVIAIVIACIANILAVLSIAELNAIMPNLTGGIAQYTLAGLGPLLTIVTMVGGYLISNVFAAPAEGAMFANVMTELTGEAIPPEVFSVGITIILVFINLKGINMSTILQEIVATFMVLSLLILSIIGAFGIGTNATISQEAVISSDLKDVLPLTATAFWFFIGAEFIVPLGKDMKNSRKVPLSMILSLVIMGLIQIIMIFGFKNYTVWSELGTSASPHMLYAVNMLGKFGRYWMIIVAIFAAVSTQNSIICSVSEICCGMAKMNLIPAFFQKKNKNGAPYWVIIILGIFTCLIEASGISTGSQVAFLTLTCSLFWMLSYITSHINVIILRRKMKNVPRTFKTPFFPLLQIVGIALQIYMMLNISPDPVQKRNIYLLCIALFIGLFIYAFIWVKYKLKLPLLKGIGVHQVMMMESPQYHEVHKFLKSQNNESEPD